MSSQVNSNSKKSVSPIHNGLCTDCEAGRFHLCLCLSMGVFAFEGVCLRGGGGGSTSLLDKLMSCIHGNYDVKQNHLMFN